MRRPVAFMLLALLGLVLAGESPQSQQQQQHNHRHRDQSRDERPTEFAPQYRAQKEYIYQWVTSHFILNQSVVGLSNRYRPQ